MQMGCDQRLRSRRDRIAGMASNNNLGSFHPDLLIANDDDGNDSLKPGQKNYSDFFEMTEEMWTKINAACTVFKLRELDKDDRLKLAERQKQSSAVGYQLESWRCANQNAVMRHVQTEL